MHLYCFFEYLAHKVSILPSVAWARRSRRVKWSLPNCGERADNKYFCQNPQSGIFTFVFVIVFVVVFVTVFAIVLQYSDRRVEKYFCQNPRSSIFTFDIVIVFVIVFVCCPLILRQVSRNQYFCQYPQSMAAIPFPTISLALKTQKDWKRGERESWRFSMERLRWQFRTANRPEDSAKMIFTRVGIRNETLRGLSMNTAHWTQCSERKYCALVFALEGQHNMHPS